MATRRRRARSSVGAAIAEGEYRYSAPSITAFTLSTTVNNTTLLAGDAAVSTVIRWIDIDLEVFITDSSVPRNGVEMMVLRVNTTAPGDQFVEDTIAALKRNRQLFVYDFKNLHSTTNGMQGIAKWTIRLRNVVLPPDDNLILQLKGVVAGTASSAYKVVAIRWAQTLTG